MKWGIPGLVILALAACASGPQPAPGADVASADQEVTCRIVQATGTRLVKRKVCLTRAEWEGIEREAQEHSQRMQNTNRSLKGE